MDSVYVHVPFCLAKKCLYCDFVSVPYGRSLSERYLSALSKEMSLIAAEKFAAEKEKENKTALRTLFIGGGTPTALEAGQLEKLFSSIRKNFDFQPGPEATIEVNPATAGPEKFRLLLEAGVSRVSIGVQSFSGTELDTLGRLHSSQDALNAVRTAREAGFEDKNISIDLIYGIPGQTAGSWRRTLEAALALGVGHISAYELTLEDNTPISGLVKSGALRMPEEDEALRLYFLAEQMLGKAGFVHYEVSNYALSGHESLHNMNYWQRGEYLGLGAAAHSFIEGKRWKNTDDISRYMDLLEKDILPVEEVCKLTAEEEKREFVFLGLRTLEGISISTGESLFGADMERAARQFVKEGFLEISKGRLHATRAGFPLLDGIVLRLLAGLGL